MEEKAKYKIPEGLYKCSECGEYKGSVKAKYLNWDYSFDKTEMEESEEDITVLCLCNGILCPKCKKTKIHKPISNSYYTEDNIVEHWPWFTGMMGCDECKKRTEEN